MPKTAKKQASEYKLHELQLIPLRNDLYFKQPVTLSFCKDKEEHQGKSANKRQKTCKSSCSCCPVFNRDNNYATSAFILPEQKKNYIENAMKFKLQHQFRIKEYSDQKSEILVPKPKSKQPFCNVCRLNYDDYLDHIGSVNHKNNIERAPFTRLIKQFEKKYDKVTQGRNSQSKNCFNTDTTQNVSQTEQEVEMLGLPMKKFKKDSSFTPTICYPVQINTINGFGDMGTITQIPHIQNFCSTNQMPTLPLNYFNLEMGHQLQSFPTLVNSDIFPMISPMNSIPCGQNVVVYPFIFCNSFQNFQSPSTYFNIPINNRVEEAFHT